MILEDILTHKRKELGELKLRFPIRRIEDALRNAPPERRPFARALENRNEIHIVAEIKKRTPVSGVLQEKFNPLQIAELYELAGASAISVLTETAFFEGRPSYLRTVRRVSSLPLLRKDFVIDRYQIYESALLAADAVLLISSILTEEELRRFIREARELKMDPLVEVHAESDLKKALECGADLIGINTRNLRTLRINPHVVEKLIRQMPKGIQVIVESGIESYEEILRYKSFGLHAFLVGTALMKAEDVVKKLRELRGYRNG